VNVSCVPEASFVIVPLLLFTHYFLVLHSQSIIVCTISSRLHARTINITLDYKHQTKMYVSITGLTLHSVWHYPKFWSHALPSMMQAKAAPGNVLADAKYIDGTQHTLSVWKDRQSMLRYMRTGNHVKAMKIFDDIATGKVYGYETDDETAPTWEEARKLYDTNGRLVGKAGREAKKRAQRENDVIVNNDKVPEVVSIQ